MMQETKFPNWQSRLFLSAIARRQPIRAAALPRPVRGFLHWYEKHILKVDDSKAPPDRPVFLVGMPRSGTTMVQDILCSHPQIAYINNTMYFFPDCFCSIEHYRRMLRLDFESDRYLADSVSVSASSPSDAVAVWEKWFGLDVYDLGFKPLAMADFPQPVVDDIHATIRKVVWSCGAGRSRFFTKLLVVLPYLEIIRDIFPGARFVHIIRDARNTANSLLKLYRTEVEHQDKMDLVRPAGVKGERYFISYPRFPRLKEYVEDFGLDDIRTTANLWNDEITYVDSLRDKLPNFHEVRYEDIVADPAREIGKLLEFCQLSPLDEKCEAIWKKIREVGSLRHTNKYGNFPAIEEICAQNMRKHGYAV